MAKSGGPGKGGKPTRLNPQFAANLRHYWPLQEGTALGTTLYQNLGNPVDVLRSNAAADNTLIYGMANTRGTLAIGVDTASSRGLNLNPVVGLLDVGKRFSMGAWVGKPSSSLSNRPILTRVISNGTFTRANFWLDIRVATSVPRITFTAGSAVYRTAEGSVAIPQHMPLSYIVGTYDGITLKIYMNGQLAGTLATTDTPDTVSLDARINVGCFNAVGAESYGGPIAHPFIMDRTLDAGEVKWLFENPEGFTQDPGPLDDEILQAQAAAAAGRLISPTLIIDPTLRG